MALKHIPESRIREDITILKQHTDENGICVNSAPAPILKEHWGYETTAPIYRDLEILEARGRLTYYPPGNRTYHVGFQVDPITPTALEKRLAYIKDRIGADVEPLIDELKELIQDIGRLAITQRKNLEP